VSRLLDSGGLWSRRLIRSLSGGLPRKCCFVHIPKCAGTSLNRALASVCGLRQRYNRITSLPSRQSAEILFGVRPSEMFGTSEEADEAYRAIFDHREVLMTYALANGETVVTGHFLYSDRAFRAFREHYGFITVLRAPESRMISHYGYIKATGELESSFDDFLQSPLARRHGSEMTRYLCGTPDRREDQLAEALELAKQNLRNFAVVGFTDAMDTFAKDFKAAFQVPLKIPRRNTAKGAKPTLSSDQTAALKRIGAIDQELYDWARANVRQG